MNECLTKILIQIKLHHFSLRLFYMHIFMIAATAAAAAAAAAVTRR